MFAVFALDDEHIISCVTLASYLTLFCLHFLNYNIRIIIAPIS